SQPSAGLIAAAWIANERGVVADNEDRFMAKFLEQAQFAQRHRMAQMNVDAGRVDAILDPERLASLQAAFELLPQFLLGHDLLDAATDQGQLLGNGFHDALPFGLCEFTKASVHADVAGLPDRSLQNRPGRRCHQSNGAAW